MTSKQTQGGAVLEHHQSPRFTVDELSRAAGTTTRQVRALQTQGLLPRPDLVGRTGYYGTGHLDRLRAILRLQSAGFSLASVAALLHAWEAGMTLEQVLGLPAPARRVAGHRLTPNHDAGGRDLGDEDDVFGDMAGVVDRSWARQGRLLSLVPSTILDQAAAS